MGGLGGGGRMGGGGGLAMLLPLLFRTIGMKGIILLVVAYFALKFFLGVDLINMVNGGGGGVTMPGNTTQIQLPNDTNLGQSANNSSLEWWLRCCHTRRYHHRFRKGICSKGVGFNRRCLDEYFQ